MIPLTRVDAPETVLAKVVPRAAMTERVRGIPTRPNKMQNTRPHVVTGAMLPYPATKCAVSAKKRTWVLYYY